MVLLSNSQQWNRYESTSATPYVAKSLASTAAATTTGGATTTMTNEQGALLIVPFGGSAPPAATLDKTVLGGKGVGLQTMGAIGIDVPPGFTLTTETCGMFQEEGGLPDHVWQGVLDNIRRVENDMGGRKFGDTEQMPLLLSCRSGAAISMPGMMDTVLNVGLNSDTVQALAKATNNPKFAYDSFRRLLDMLGDVVSFRSWCGDGLCRRHQLNIIPVCMDCDLTGVGNSPRGL
jgi:pyruvate, orthophosphate dikinase